MVLRSIRSAKTRVLLVLVGLAVALLPFQNCILSSMSGKVVDLASANGGAPGATGLSPNSVQLAWAGVASSTSYNVYNMNLGNRAVATTVFTTARVNGLVPETDYSFSVRGSRGTGQFLTDSLGTYSFTTWKLFSNVTFTATAETDSSQTLTWSYEPWARSNLPASLDAQRGSRASCAFVPVPAGTDPMTLNPTSPAPGVTPLTIQGPLFAQKLNLGLTTIDNSLTYAVQCTALFVDDTKSASTQNFILSPSHQINACQAKATLGSSYICSPNLRIPAASSAPAYTLALADGNTCAWARIVGTDIQSTGILGAASLGTCNLAYRYTVADLGYQSPVVSQTVTISVPNAFNAFPSFAVRALSGAVAFPHLYSQLQAQPDVRAQIRADLVSDFGYGSNFFAGGSTPFPTVNPAAPSLSSSFFYGFPVAASQNGVRPTGYSIDAIRFNWQSSSPADEGFLRGNMVIPNVQVTNPAFLAATGASVGPRLFDFLTNRYTFDGGTSYAPAALGFFLTTISDRDLNGDPVSSAWNGIVIEQPKITFNLPPARAIAALIPPSGIKGSSTTIANADPQKTVLGLTTAPSNNSLFYAMNCQNTPGTYSNPAACKPPSGAALPTSITCLGDILVDAPLLLVNPTIITDANGCRIHSTASIFVQGTITVLNGDGTPNAGGVQLMSARAVVFGFSLPALGVDTAGNRTSSGTGILDQMFANGTNNPYLTSVANGPGAAAAALNAVASDAFVVGLKSYDAPPLTSGATSYLHVTVAAPYVFSNYSGIMKGAIIAEVAAFPYLKFDADPALIGVTPFPLFTGTNAPLTVQTQ